MGILLRRPHAGRENPRAPTPPIHNDTSSCENDHDLGQTLDLCFGVEFF